MCTVSWTHTSDGYHLFCNRDELRTRGIASPPATLECTGTRYIAPTDADHGGTWIAVNEHGIAMCLLNGHAPKRLHATRSRGFVIPELIWVRSIDDGAFLFRETNLTPCAPFTLLMLEPGQPATVATWDGSCVTIDCEADRQAPLVSSSFDLEGVRSSRLREFARLDQVTPESLHRFHTSHSGGGPYGTCMHRPDAETVSFSHIIVARGEIQFRYSPAAPCRLAA